MPRSLAVLCYAYASLLVLHAAMAPFVEEGLGIAFPLIIDACLLILLWRFSRRAPNTLPWLRSYCGVATIMLSLFAFLDEPTTVLLQVSRALLFVEAAASAALYVALRRRETTNWFYAGAAP